MPKLETAFLGESIRFDHFGSIRACPTPLFGQFQQVLLGSAPACAGCLFRASSGSLSIQVEWMWGTLVPAVLDTASGRFQAFYEGRQQQYRDAVK